MHYLLQRDGIIIYSKNGHLKGSCNPLQKNKYFLLLLQLNLQSNLVKCRKLEAYRFSVGPVRTVFQFLFKISSFFSFFEVEREDIPLIS